MLITARDRSYIDRSTLLPFRREGLSRSGRLLKSVHIDEDRPWQGVTIPWRVRFVDHLRHGAEASIEVLAAEALEEDRDAFFSRERLGATAPDAGREGR